MIRTDSRSSPTSVNPQPTTPMRLLFSAVLLLVLLATGIVLAIGRGLAALIAPDAGRPMRHARG